MVAWGVNSNLNTGRPKFAVETGHHCHTAGAATSRRSRGGLGIPLTTLIAKVAATVPGEPQSVAEAAAKGDIIVVRLALPPTLARGMVGKAVERASFASSMS